MLVCRQEGFIHKVTYLSCMGTVSKNYSNVVSEVLPSILYGTNNTIQVISTEEDKPTFPDTS